MDYNVKIAAFEGPMDLLLHLIKKNKIDIYDIPMAQLTQQYMDYIDESKEFNVEIAAEFLVVAAQLIQIKSRMILPSPKLESQSNDETDETADPREELVQRLLEYQRFQKISQTLLSMIKKEERFIKRQPMKLANKTLPPQNISAEQLLQAFTAVFTDNEELTIPQVLVASEQFHVKDKMSEILIQLADCDKIKLSELITTKNVGELIAVFLAILELIKRQKITAEQLRPFSDIMINLRLEI
ncbi:MAG: segregation/condensation protein A [Selenomonadaceae bacterium]|nr:segregation/condensation protein A [Selenomonadaceae bacterium]